MTMKSNKLAVWAGAAAFALLTPLAHANYVVNGGFETGNFTGWTQNGDTSFTGVDTLSAHSGNFGAFFGPGTPGGISQSIATMAGVQYTVSFWLANSAATPADGNSFSWSWNGGPAQATSFTDAASFPYTQFSETVTGDGGSDALTFAFQNTDSFWLLDDVSVVPEPGTLALMGVAMIGAGVVRRRKKLD